MTTGPVVSDLIDSYGSSVVYFVLHDSPHEHPWTAARRAYYPFSGYPTYMIDGINDSWHGSPAWDNWEPDTDLRLPTQTDVTINLSATDGATPEERELTATVCVEAGGTGKPMRIYIGQILDGYPPTAANITRYGLRQMAPTEDIVLAADTCIDVTRSFTLDATDTDALEEVSFVAWAQEDLASGLAEVYQATQLNWPDHTLTVFKNGFENGNTDGWSIVSP